MWKRGLLRAAITSNVPPVWPWRRTAPSLRSSANRRDGSRRKRRTQLKTPPSDQPREPPTSDQMHDASPIDPFLRTPTAGLAYGKLLGISRNTLKTDVVNMLDGYNLRLEDVKVDYSRAFTPMGMVVQFQSWKAFDNAARVISRKGGWRGLTDRSGTILLPMMEKLSILRKKVKYMPSIFECAPEDVERFLSGCEYNSSSFQIIFRSFPESYKFATVQFTSQTEAIYSLLAKNKGRARMVRF